MKKPLLILGTSRSQGHTRQVVDHFLQDHDWPLVDLNSLDIGYYSYENAHAGDDFLPLMRRLVRDHDGLVLATPIYWYTMSAQLKTFFDRTSDLLTWEKDLGRQLRGMDMAVISCGSDEEIMEGFEMPFVESARYLGMRYLGHAHAWVDAEGVSDPGKDALARLHQAIAASHS